MFVLTPVAWAVLALGAFFVGISKTALPGIAMISVAVFASVLPARSSTAALLLLLLVGDLFAIAAYRRFADWLTLRSLVPTVLVGVALGSLFLKFSTDTLVKKVIGGLLLALIALTLWLRWRARVASQADGRAATSSTEATDDAAPGRGVRGFYGVLGGFTTMVANAGGAVMSLYFLSARFDVLKFLGTSAWFFFAVNILKLPFSAAAGLLTAEVAVSMLALVPLVVVGSLIGRWLASRMTNAVFDPIVWVLTTLGAFALLL